MLAGYPPFFDDNPFGIYEKILGGRVEWPRHLDATAKDLIKKLLTQDRTKRLGNMKVEYERDGFICLFIHSFIDFLLHPLSNGGHQSWLIMNPIMMVNWFI